MHCRGCLNRKPIITRTVYDHKEGVMETCDRCSVITMSTVADVYWPGNQHTNPNITDNMGNPIVLRSRNHKAKVMKEKGIIEVGDRFHGASFIPGRKPGDYLNGKKK